MGKSGCDQRYIDAQKADLSEAEFECVKNRICDKNEEMSKRGIRIPRDAVDWKDMNWFNFRRFVGDTYPFFQDGVLKFSNLGQYTKEERTRFFIDLWMNDIGKEKFNDIEKLPPHPDLYVQVFNHPYMFGVNGEVEGFGICKDIELAWQEKTAYDEYRGGGLRFAPDDWKNLIDKIQELGEKGANLRALFLEKRATEIYFEMLFDRTVQSKEKAQQQIERIPFFQEEPEWAGDTASVPLKYAREFWGEYLLFVSRYKEHEKIMRSYLADKNGLVNRLREIERKFPEVTAKLLNPDTAMFFAWSIDKNVFCLQGLHQLEQIGSAAGKAAEIVDVDCVALSGKFEHRLKLGTVRIFARYLFSEPFINLVDTQSFHLSGLVLFYGRNPNVSYIHRLSPSKMSIWV